MPSRSILSGALVVALAITSLAGCGALIEPQERQPLTVGSHNSLGNEVIAQVYGQYLGANGYDVSYNTGIGARDDYLDGLQAGMVDLVPDLAADLLYGLDSTATATRLDDVDDALTVALSQLELRILDPTPAELPDALVVTKDFAQANALSSIADLAKLETPLSIAATPEFEDMPYGRAGLTAKYAITDWTEVAVAEGGEAAVAAAVVGGSAQAAVLSALSSVVTDAELVVLEDPLRLFPAQNIVPVVSADIRSVKLADLVDTLSVELSTTAVEDLIDRAAKGSATPARIAERWLKARNLIG